MNVVVGNNGVEKDCGSGGVWGGDTFYFFIRETGSFNITIGTSVQNVTTVIPGDKKGLFIVENIMGVQGRRPRLCILLADVGGSGGDEVEGSAEPMATESQGPGGIGGGVGGGGGDGMEVTPEATDGGSDADGEGTTGVGGITGDGDETDVDAGATPTSDGVDDDGSGVSGDDGGDGGIGFGTTAEPESTADGDGAVCFPGSGMVELEDGRLVEMKNVDVGDVVRTSRDTWSKVFMFTHRHNDIKYKFVQLDTEAGQKISLTPSHYMHVGQFGNSKLVQARHVQVGDVVTVGDSNEATEIVGKRMVESYGLYNPQTLDGSIVVDNVRVSTYTAAVHPWLAHNVLLAPVRWLYARGMVQKPFGKSFDLGSDLLARLAPAGPKELL